MLPGDTAGESWDVRARLEGGAYFFARFWVTNEGPATHTAVAMGSFLGTDGTREDFRYGRERTEWTLAGGGRYLEIASAVLDLRPPVGRVELDTNRQGIKIYLRFPIEQSPRGLCARRDEGGGADVLALAAPLDGMAWTRSMTAPLTASGTIDVTHAWSVRSELDYVEQRTEVAGRDGDVAVYASLLVAPTGERRSCTAVVRGDVIAYESQDATVAVAAAARDGEGGAYPIPERIRIADDRMELVIVPRRPLLSIDPLDVVPQPFRFLLGLRSRPRRSWSEGTWRLRLVGPDGRDAVDRRGNAVIAVAYTRPRSEGSE